MLTKKQLSGIGDLKLSGVLDQLEGSRFDEYVAELERFVKNFPNWEAELKNFFKMGEIEAFRRRLQEVANTLTMIHAEEVARSCIKFVGEVSSSKREVAEAYFLYLLTTISTLSIDIQMALNESAMSGPAAAPAHQDSPDKDRGGQRIILAVDDVSLTLNGLKLILKDMPEYKLVCVTSGATALRFLNTNTADLFILDIEMPEMDGYELAKKIRQKGFTAPIVFLTGNATAEYVKMAMQSGAADFIVKPVNKEIVLAKIKKFVG